MRIFKTRAVVRFAKAERIADAALVEAIGNAERGLIDADLGGGLIKLRIARPGAGKRGGYRMLIGFRAWHSCASLARTSCGRRMPR